VVVGLDPALYPPEAVRTALAAFANHASIRLEVSEPGLLRLTIEGDSRAVDEFLNYALVASLELHLAKF